MACVDTHTHTADAHSDANTLLSASTSLRSDLSHAVCPQTVRFKNELERNITIKLGYANAKIYQCKDPECPRPGNFLTRGSTTEDSVKQGKWTYELVRVVS